jgi:RNA polymerase-binding transcription factor DksA
MLTTEQVNYFRTRLEQQREVLRAEAAQAQRQIAAPDAIADAISDRGDDGNMLSAREEAMNELALVQQTLAQVEHALQRLEAGSYGYSEVSGRPIPIERLEALPYATTLVGELSQE